jgi:hypothetical protein
MLPSQCTNLYKIFNFFNCENYLEFLNCVESLQSHFILIISHWSSELPVCFPSQGTWVQNPRGVLMWNRDSPASVVSLHWWPRRDPITGFVALQWVLHSALRQQCVNRDRLDHTALLSRFHACCLSPFRLHNRWSQLLGRGGAGALWRACNLTSFSPCLTGSVDYLLVCFPSQGTQVQNPRGILMWNLDSPVSVVLLQLYIYSIVGTEYARDILVF